MTDLERQLIDSIKHNNVQSFEIIFKSYYSKLCKYARNYVHDKIVAEDLVKDTFIKIWGNRNQLIIESSLAGYLYRSVHNNCVNYITRHKKHVNIISENGLQNEMPDIIQPLSPDYPLANLVAQELEEKIKQSIQALPDQCREIFILSRIEDLSHDEIAKKKNISANTVKAQIYRALLKLREDLKEYFPVFIAIFFRFF